MVQENFLLAVVLLIDMHVCGAFSPKVIYVDTCAGGANNGHSWKDAYRCLQTALVEAAKTAKPIEIRVAQGTYRPAQYDGVAGTNREASFSLINGVTIKGGYGGVKEADPNERDVGRFTSILSGDLAGNDVEVASPLSLPSDLNRADNSNHVIVSIGTNGDAVLDGFTITGGHCQFFADWPGYYGGGSGIYNEAGSPTLIDCVFVHNLCTGDAGGTMFNTKGSSPMLIRCIFVDNYSQVVGGSGLRNQDSSPRLIDCVFTGNCVEIGGGAAVLNVSSRLTLEHCRFSGNWVGDARLSYGMGGAIFNLSGSLVLNGCVFSGNMAARGGAIASMDSSHLSLKGCILNGNRARYGGAILCSGNTACYLIDCKLVANEAILEAGAIVIGSKAADQSILKATNCLVVGNRASGIPSEGALGRIGAVSLYSGKGMFASCTFAGNSAVGDPSIGVLVGATCEVTNSILWDCTALGQEPYDGRMAVSYSDTQGYLAGTGNINLDPCFARPGYWDPNGTPDDPYDDIWVDGDYHLKSQAGRWDPARQTWVKDDVTSPCIDAGDPNSPLGLEPFPNGGRINMGAYGGTQEASKSYFGGPTCETIVSGDIDGDCKVDLQDLAILASHWLEGW